MLLFVTAQIVQNPPLGDGVIQERFAADPIAAPFVKRR